MLSASIGLLLRRVEVEAKTGLSRSTIYAKTNPRDRGFDPGFPVPVRIGATSVRWLAAEVDAWIKSRPRARDACLKSETGSSK